MGNELMFWAWSWWNYATVDYTTSNRSTSFTLNVVWNCPNSYLTSWRTETDGVLVKGGTTYYAAAYDIFDGGAQSCGA